MKGDPERLQIIRRRLEDALQPTFLQIQDEGHQHVGHPGAKSGKGHFFVEISSARFAQLTLLEAHRLVNNSVDDLFATHIHALRIHIK